VYATVADVQSRIPEGTFTIGPASSPSEAMVAAWIAADSAWVDATLRWKYTVPVSEAADVAMLAPIVAALAAAKIWAFVGGHNGEMPSAGTELRREALVMLAFDAKRGRSNLVLPSTVESDTGEAAVGQPESTFTDPDADDAIPRMFDLGTDQW